VLYDCECVRVCGSMFVYKWMCVMICVMVCVGIGVFAGMSVCVYECVYIHSREPRTEQAGDTFSLFQH